MQEFASDEVNPFALSSLADLWVRLRRNPRTGEPRKLPTGADGTSIEVFERNLKQNLREIERSILRLNPDNSAYSFGPLLEISRKKTDGGLRRIYIPRIRDQLVLRVIHEDLLHAARLSAIDLKIPSPSTFIQSFRRVIEVDKPAFMVRTDIKSFYDSIPRDRLLSRLGQLPLHPLSILLLQKWNQDARGRKPWTSGSSSDYAIEGLPQGLSISSSLSEFWAIQIDSIMKEQFRFFRYVDDIAVLCNSEEEGRLALQKLDEIVATLGLALSPTKTKIQKISEGVRWLGLIHYPDRIEAEEERIEKWLRRFISLRKEAVRRMLLPDFQSQEARQEIIQEFERAVKNEITGKTSSRPAWYAGVEDKGQWKKLDRSLHALIRSVYRKAGTVFPADYKYPSIHRCMMARKSHL